MHPKVFKSNKPLIQLWLLPYENKGPMISGLLTFSSDARNFDFFLCNFLNTITSCRSNKISLWVEYGLWATSLQLPSVLKLYKRKIKSMFRKMNSMFFAQGKKLTEQKIWKVSVQTGDGP